MFVKFTSLFILLLCCSNVYATEITNFKSGLVCQGLKGEDSICHETTNIYITGQGKCVWGGERKSCTWYGFEFDYFNNTNEAILNCKYMDSQAALTGNTKEVEKTESSVGEFSIKLSGKQGHYYHPQYFLMTTLRKERALLKSNTVCSVDGRVLFTMKNKVYFPIVSK